VLVLANFDSRADLGIVRALEQAAVEETFGASEALLDLLAQLPGLRLKGLPMCQASLDFGGRKAAQA